MVGRGWRDIGRFLEGFYILSRCNFTRKAVLRDLMEANEMHPPSPIAKGSIVTTMSSPIGAGLSMFRKT